MIPLGGYAGGGSTDWRPAVAWIIIGPLFIAIGMTYLVGCIFIAGHLGNSMSFPFVFFGAGVPLLVLISNWSEKP